VLDEEKINPDDVRIRIKYMGVSYADCLVRLGIYQSAKDNSSYPIIPGFEFSGIVMESRSSNFKNGDEVFGVTLFGAYQEEIVLPAQYVYKVPKGLTLQTASSILVNFLTAYHMLHNLAHIQNQEKILIRSIAGGVGNWLRILSKNKNSKISGTTSNLSKTQNLNKDIKIYLHEYNIQDKFDIIVNAQGGKSLKIDFENLNKNGRLIVYGFHSFIRTNKNGNLTLFSYLKMFLEYLRMPKFHPFNLVNENKSVMGCNISYLFSDINKYEQAMNFFLKILPTIEIPKITEFRFEQVSDAHRLIESGKSIGKIILKI
jgi:NADPH:quinone reductase-like Zn-dependent oxidoreductase